MKYLIDGYNVIHQMSRLKGKRLRNQREGLIRLLEEAQARNKRLSSLTVIFDGRSDVVCPRSHSSVKVVFSRGCSADKKIKEILNSVSYSRDIAVVSDDRQVRSFTNSLGAKKTSVQQFLKMLSTAPGRRESTFKLDDQEARQINQELEKIWLQKGTN